MTWDEVERETERLAGLRMRPRIVGSIVDGSARVVRELEPTTPSTWWTERMIDLDWPIAVDPAGVARPVEAS